MAPCACAAHKPQALALQAPSVPQPLKGRKRSNIHGHSEAAPPVPQEAFALTGSSCSAPRRPGGPCPPAGPPAGPSPTVATAVAPPSDVGGTAAGGPAQLRPAALPSISPRGRAGGAGGAATSLPPVSLPVSVAQHTLRASHAGTWRAAEQKAPLSPRGDPRQTLGQRGGGLASLPPAPAGVFGSGLPQAGAFALRGPQGAHGALAPAPQAPHALRAHPPPGPGASASAAGPREPLGVAFVVRPTRAQRGATPSLLA